MFGGILIKLNLNAFVLTMLYSLYKDCPDIIGSVHDRWLTDLFPILTIQPLGKIPEEVPELFHTSRQCTPQPVGMTVLVITVSGSSLWLKY